MSNIYKFFNFRDLFSLLTYEDSGYLISKSIIGNWNYVDPISLVSETYIINSNGTIQRVLFPGGTFNGTYTKINEYTINATIENRFYPITITFDLNSDTIYIDNNQNIRYFRQTIPSPNSIILSNKGNNIIIGNPYTQNINENYKNNYKSYNLSLKIKKPDNINLLPSFNLNIGGIDVLLFGTDTDSIDPVNIDGYLSYKNRIFTKKDILTSNNVLGPLEKFQLSSLFNEFTDPYITILLKFINGNINFPSALYMKAYAYKNAGQYLEIPQYSFFDRSFGVGFVNPGNITISLENKSQFTLTSDIIWSKGYFD
jgi:hypothetical protein